MSQIEANELLLRLQNGEELNLLDVRGSLEYLTYNVGGKNVPLGKLAESLTTLGYNKTDEIIVICKIGLRSKIAQSILVNNGYQQVRNLKGGLIALQKIKN